MTAIYYIVENEERIIDTVKGTLEDAQKKAREYAADPDYSNDALSIVRWIEDIEPNDS